MIRIRSIASALALALAAAAPVAAQSEILLRTTSRGQDRLRADTAGGLVSMGVYGLSTCAPIPATGAGARLLWYPCKAAFRAGSVPGTEWDNSQVGPYSWAGGDQTTASGMGSFAFGQQTTASANFSTGFGTGHVVAGVGGFAAGVSNRCSAFACVALGFTANAGGQGSIAIGYRATATSDYSASIGYRVTNVTSSGNPKRGAVLIGATDLASSDSMRAQHDGEFRVRAPGGVRLRTSNAANSTPGTSGNVGCDLEMGSSIWVCASSRTLKSDFMSISGSDVLQRLRTLPITTWRYTGDSSAARHIGPVAEDWHAAFGLAGDGHAVGVQDLAGVALAAAQELDGATRELDARVRALQEALAEKTAEVDALRGRLEAQARVLEAMEARLRALEADR